MEKENNKVIDTEEHIPYYSKEFVDFIKDKFDIRKSIWYEQDIGVLKGIQNVITYIEQTYDNINNKHSKEE